jgi:hypothetical protein
MKPAVLHPSLLLALYLPPLLCPSQLKPSTTILVGAQVSSTNLIVLALVQSSASPFQAKGFPL